MIRPGPCCSLVRTGMGGLSTMETKSRSGPRPDTALRCTSEVRHCLHSLRTAGRGLPGELCSSWTQPRWRACRCIFPLFRDVVEHWMKVGVVYN